MTQVKVDISCLHEYDNRGFLRTCSQAEGYAAYIADYMERDWAVSAGLECGGVAAYWDLVTADQVKAAVNANEPTEGLMLNLFVRGGDSDEWTPA